MSGSLANELAVLQANADFYAPQDGSTPGTITLADGDLFPGSGGSFIADGHTWTLPQMDGLPNFGQVTMDGQPVLNGDYTAASAVSGGTPFFEDGKGGTVYGWDDATQQFVFVGGAMPASDGSGGTPSSPITPTTADTTPTVITPGNGSFTAPTPDGTVGVYSIDPNGDVADLNGQPITSDSGGTGVLQLTADQMVVGQDETSGDWFQLVSKGSLGSFEWQLTSAPTGAPAPAASSGASMQFIAPNTSVASIDFTQSCSHG